MAGILHLPQDILLQIVQRLPLRSVLLCKRVSKQLKDLINDPLFYKSYKDGSRTALFGSLDSLHCFFINDDNDTYTVHRVTTPSSNCKFLGTSHGMACFKQEDGSFLVYNLFTGSLHTVANAPKSRWFKVVGHHRLQLYGFGYDSYGDDYKIVHLNEHNPFEGVWIYSLTNKVWNSFRCLSYKAVSWYAQDHVACLINGILHWLMNVTTITFKKLPVIISYDLHTNRFGEMQGPPTSAAEPDGMEDSLRSTVAELNGQLCYVRHMCDRRMIVWVMKDYGVGDSWERFWTVDHDLEYARRMVPATLLYKCASGRRLVLFVRDYESEQELIWYNIDENKVEADCVCMEIGKETVIGEEQQKGKYHCCWYFAICLLFVCITLICVIHSLA